MSAENSDFSILAGMPALKRSVRQSVVLRRSARILGWLLLATGVVCGILYVVMRFWLFPWLGENREWVAEKLSNAVGAQVSIERLEADWFWLRPRLHLEGLAIRSGEHEALRLKQVEATLSWTSLPRWMPYFRALEIVGPEIELARDKNGVFTVAGIRMDPDSEKRGNPIAWLLEQSRVAVRDATLVWNDGLRDAPPLRLTSVQFSFERGLFSHRLELQAQPPEELATRFELNGDVRRYDSTTLGGIDGRFSVGLERADLGGWAAWVDYPVPCKGRGRVRLWFDSDGKGAGSLSADLDLEGVETTLASGLTPLRFDRLNGRVQARQTPRSVEFGARGLWLESREVRFGTPIDFRLELRNADDGTPNGGALSVSSLDLTTFIQLAESLPLDRSENARALLTEFDPRGYLRTFSLEWEGEIGALQAWKIDTEFEGIRLTARGLIPGMGNMSGRIRGNSREGTYVFSSRDSYIDLPRVFEQVRIPVTSLDASGGWNHNNGNLAVTLDAIEVANDDAAGRANGSYWPAESGSGDLDITGVLTRVQGAAAWRYIPIIAGPNIREWLKNSLAHGNVTGAKVKLKGPIDSFPFRDGKGEFLVEALATDTRLDYSKGWPSLDRLDAELRFTGPGLVIESRGGDIFGVRVEPIRVEIPDLLKAIMTIDGGANGPSADFLRFIAESPLSERLHGFTKSLKAEGNGRLDLKLVMPLHDVSETEVTGEYRFAANRIRMGGVASGPALEAAEGSVSFTGEALEELSIRGRLLGGESSVKGKAGAGGLELTAHGQVAAAAAQETFGWPLLGWISGNTPWSAEMTFGQDKDRIVVRSGLKGLSSRLPAPFAKEADEAWPLEIVTTSQGTGRRTTAKLGDRLEAVLVRDASGVVHGGVGLYQPPPASSSNGVHVAALLDTLDIDAWQWTLAAGESESQSQSEGGDRNGENAPLLISVTLDARRMRAFGYNFNEMKLRGANSAESWTAQLNSTEAQGVISWRRGGDGILSARLSRLALSGDGNGDRGGSDSSSSSPVPPRGLPGLDVRAEEFAVGARELGQLEVRATNQEGGWKLDNLSIRHTDAEFSGSGYWKPDAQYSTLDFTLDVGDVGRFVTAMGYNNVVQGGQAKFAGKVDWKGPPTRINYPTLSGQLELDASNGRFERIEPGFGRLLGVLSLQALPRRVTLDFRDVFSDGFAFDSIKGEATVSEGVMRIPDGVAIAGPSARVLMLGQTDITAETQDLQVRVYPSLSETVAIGAAIVNPVAGAMTFLAQKVFGNPIEKLFSYDYRITGSWVDPVVEKAGSAPPSESAPKGGRRGS